MSGHVRIHGSCVARDGAGVLIIGASGSGKSDLTLRLLGRGFDLVADDQVDLDHGLASAPEALVGLLEVRGLGIVHLPHVPAVKLRVVIALSDQPERLPRPERHAVHGVPEGIPLVRIRADSASAPDRVALALDCALGLVKQHAGAFAP
jgi:HPr kinase/phosphorylase